MDRPDPGREVHERLLGQISPDDRARHSAAMRQVGRLLVWQQLEEAHIDGAVERAEFVLRRYFPEMPEAWYGDVIAKLAARHAAGEWHGFERPE